MQRSFKRFDRVKIYENGHLTKTKDELLKMMSVLI